MPHGRIAHGLGRLAAWLATAPRRRRMPSRQGRISVQFEAEDGVRLSGWVVDPPSARATVVLGHGYRDDRRQLFDHLAAPLAASGHRVLAFDFRAHGCSEGDRITIGVEEARDVRAALGFAASLHGGQGVRGGVRGGDASFAPRAPVRYVGFSMGAAAYLLSGQEAERAVLDSPYDTLRAAVEVRLRRFRVPRAIADAVLHYSAARLADQGAARLAGRGPDAVDEIRPVERASRLARPTLFVFATSDPWLSGEVRARYREALSEACVLDEVTGGHADHFGRSWVERVVGFVAGG